MDSSQHSPASRLRGLFRREYEGETLREHLGLAAPSDACLAGAAA